MSRDNSKFAKMVTNKVFNALIYRTVARMPLRTTLVLLVVIGFVVWYFNLY